jgi:enoyl-[acyl-carrier protein] reductase I
VSFLNLADKRFLVMGVSNRKSVAYSIADGLKKENAELVFTVQNNEQAEFCRKKFPDSTVFHCDVENKDDLVKMGESVKELGIKLDGLVHSIAFADYSEGLKPFHETKRENFLQAVTISCFSIVEVCNTLKECFNSDASVVTISISTTEMTSESYGYMAPVKAALDSSICFLAKSFSNFSSIRFNSVRAGLLKTSSSAGIPGYIDNYLFAEKATLRKKNLKTSEVADTALFLLSPRSSGINAQGIVVDAGMSKNYFDKEIITKATR